MKNMEFFLELRFEDRSYNAIVHFATTFIAEDKAEAELFFSELLAAFNRKSVIVFSASYNRIDNDAEFKERMLEYHNFYLSRASAKIQVEQFVVDKPNQDKSLWDNMVEKYFSGENSTANIGKKYNIPVNVYDKESRRPITEEFYYFSVEHLIPKK